MGKCKSKSESELIFSLANLDLVAGPILGKLKLDI